MTTLEGLQTVSEMEELMRIRYYMPVHCFEQGSMRMNYSLWSKGDQKDEAPVLLQRIHPIKGDYDYLFDFVQHSEGGEAVILTPHVCLQQQGFLEDLVKFGWTKITEPPDEPYCESCNKQCGIKWDYDEDGAGNIEASAGSDCCGAALWCDPFGQVEFVPDPDKWGA